MAGEIQHRHSATGANLYAVIVNLDAEYWNTAGTPAFETVTPANWGDYDIVLSETVGGSYEYGGDWPAGLVAAVGWYRVLKFVRAGGSPAIGDSLEAQELLYWNGDALVRTAVDVNGEHRIDLSQTNTTETAKTSVGGQIRMTHALAGGTKITRDNAAAAPTFVHRNEADSAALVTRTLSVAGTVETWNPT